MTNGRIGILKDDNGQVESIYVHCDADRIGKVLKKHYADKAKVEKLISLGDCSSIGPEVEPPEGAEHSYDNPIPGVTVAYVRDRDEDWDDCHPSLHMDEATFWKSDFGYHGYLYKDGEWWTMKKYASEPKKV